MRDYTDNTYREKGFIIMGMAAGQARLLSNNSANKPQRVAGAADN